MGIYPDRTSIETARDAAVEALTAALTSPKPSYTIDGQTVKHDEHVKTLRDSIRELTDLLKEINASEDGPGYEETIAVS